MLFLTLTTPPASASERIYWGNYDGNSIAFANVDGSGGANLPTPNVPMDGPQGFSLEPATGTLYFANYGEFPNGAGTGAGMSLGYARLDGSGGGLVPTPAGSVHGPHGTALDLAANRIYWTNESPPAIRFANLDGSGEGDLPTGTATVNGPRGLALDLANGRIYWANHDGGRISYANLNGSGGADIPTGTATVDNPEGVALYNGRIYWGGLGATSRISYANLDGSGGGDLPTGGATVDFPHGVAIDPSTGTIYWVNYTYPGGSVSFAKLDGSGGGDIPTGAASVVGPALPILLKDPIARKRPVVHGSPKPGGKLTCARSAWAPDLIASQLYQSPQTVAVHWVDNGHTLKGKDAPALIARAVGEYSCLESARNAAGSSVTISDPVGVFRLGELRRNRNRGTARLTVKLPGPGTLKLRGKAVVNERAGAAAGSSSLARKVKRGVIRLLIEAKGKARRHLDRTGKVKVRVRISYRPKGGEKGAQTRRLQLFER